MIPRKTGFLSVSAVMLMLVLCIAPVSAASTADTYGCVDIRTADTYFGVGNHLYLAGVTCCDIGGYHYTRRYTDYDPRGVLMDERHRITIDLTCYTNGDYLESTRVDFTHKLRKLTLHFILHRSYHFACCRDHYDRFSVNITSVFNANPKAILEFTLKNSYSVGACDKITVYCPSGEKIVFPKTREQGTAGHWTFDL